MAVMRSILSKKIAIPRAWHAKAPQTHSPLREVDFCRSPSTSLKIESTSPEGAQRVTLMPKKMMTEKQSTSGKQLNTLALKSVLYKYQVDHARTRIVLCKGVK